MAQGLAEALAHFLFPLLVELDRLLDKRLVRTFLCTIQVIITFRDRANGLLLSELGGSLETPDKAPTGTKRLSNLLHSSKWGAWLIARFLWQRANQQLESWTQAGEDGLVIWDESVWEKPESQQAEGLCAVRSSKAKRLTHYKKGFDTPPPKPIFVPGLQWIGLLLIGRSDQRKGWHIARGKRGSRERLLWDSRRSRWVQASVLVLPVRHPEQPDGCLGIY